MALFIPEERSAYSSEPEPELVPLSQTYSKNGLRKRLHLGGAAIDELLNSGKLRGWKHNNRWHVSEKSVQECEELMMQELAEELARARGE